MKAKKYQICSKKMSHNPNPASVRNAGGVKSIEGNILPFIGNFLALIAEN